VRLLDVVLGKPLGEHVSHRLRWVGNWKWELGIVARHGSYVLSNSSDKNMTELKDEGGAHKVFWYVYFDWFGQFTKYGADFTHAVRAIIEEEQGIIIYVTTTQPRGKHKKR